MAKKYPDLERGESASKTGRQHIPPRLYKEAVHLNNLRDKLLDLLSGTNALNARARIGEIEALLDKYIPGVEKMKTRLRKYEAEYKSLSSENADLESRLQVADEQRREKLTNRLKYGEMEQELRELHKIVDTIPPEIIAANTRLMSRKNEPEI